MKKVKCYIVGCVIFTAILCATSCREVKEEDATASVSENAGSEVSTENIAATTASTAEKVDEEMIVDEDGEPHSTIYERFLNNEETVCIDCNADVTEGGTDCFSFKKDQGKELTLSDIISEIEDYSNQNNDGYPEVSEAWISKIEYAYIDCGKDGTQELAIRMTCMESIYNMEKNIEHLIINEKGGRLETVYCNGKSSYTNSDLIITEYGCITSKEPHFDDELMDVHREMIDSDGEYHSIPPEINKILLLNDIYGFISSFNDRKICLNKEMALIQEIKNGKEVTWKELDFDKFYDNTDYSLYDRFLDHVRAEIENVLDGKYAYTSPLDEIACPLFNDKVFRGFDMGYIRKDMDRDGIEELLFGTMPSSDEIVTMYTIKNGKICCVVTGAEREPSYLCTNGAIEVSYGAASYYSLDYYRYNSGRMDRIGGLYVDENGTCYYRVDENGNFEEQKYPLEDFDKIMATKFKKYKYKKLNFKPIIKKAN